MGSTRNSQLDTETDRWYSLRLTKPGAERLSMETNVAPMEAMQARLGRLHRVQLIRLIAALRTSVDYLTFSFSSGKLGRRSRRFIQDLQRLSEDELRIQLRLWLPIPMQMINIYNGTSVIRAINQASINLGYNFREIIFELHSLLPIWSSTESRSGIGSELNSTSFVRYLLPQLLSKYMVERLLDAGCGDFYWARRMDWTTTQYTGVDIVPDVIAENKQRFSSPTVTFLCADIIQDDLPRATAILCRDCLFHFSPQDIVATVRNFKRTGARYLLTSTFQGLIENRTIVTGDFHPINLQLAPYGLPAPLECIPDAPLEKSLGIWRLNDIVVPDVSRRYS
jgi:SAM-dependent methyltransferase